jgi:hypothetical protein
MMADLGISTIPSGSLPGQTGHKYRGYRRSKSPRNGKRKHKSRRLKEGKEGKEKRKEAIYA